MCAALLLACMFCYAEPAFAYNTADAVDYADEYALSWNPAYVPMEHDCANFVSQCLQNGGYPNHGYPNNTNYTWWYVLLPYDSWSTTWSMATNLRKFLLYDNPGGYQWFYYVQPCSIPQSNSLYSGDVVFYDLDSDGYPDHTALQIGQGYDPNSWPSGSLVDAHTNNRYHVIWHLRPYNGYQWATRYWGFHIDSGN